MSLNTNENKPTHPEDTTALSGKEWSIALAISLLIGSLLCYGFYIMVIPPTKAPSNTKSTDTTKATDISNATDISSTTNISNATDVTDLSPIYEKLLFLPNLVHSLANPSQLSPSHPFRSIGVRVTFYTGLARENGGYEEKNALGYSLKIGSLAAPKDIPFGTVFIIEGLPKDVGTDIFIVDDRGGAITRMNANTIKVDVYVRRKPNESDADYFKRVNNLGVIHTTAKYKLPVT